MADHSKDQKDWVRAKLDALTPQAAPPVQAARARLNQQIAEKEQTMLEKLFKPKYRPVWAPLAVIVVLAVSLSFPQVRAVATSFLGLFRVEQIEAVQVGISLDDLSTEMESQFVALDNLLADQIVVDQAGDPVEVADFAEAEALAGFAARVPAKLAGEAQQIVFQPETSLRFTIDRDQWQALLDGMGYGEDFQIPAAADGAEVKFNLPNMIMTGFGDCNVNQAKELEEIGLPGNCTVLLQSQQPTIEAPPGLDISQAGQVMLQILGMSPEEAEAFSQRVDWATTLVVPVPQGAEYRNVTVDGVDGVLLEDSYDRNTVHYTLLWVKDGMFYALTGSGASYSPVLLANSMP
jgi:hypothetical protein